jgi:hypothetical protein
MHGTSKPASVVLTMPVVVYKDRRRAHPSASHEAISTPMLEEMVGCRRLTLRTWQAWRDAGVRIVVQRKLMAGICAQTYRIDSETNIA